MEKEQLVINEQNQVNGAITRKVIEWGKKNHYTGSIHIKLTAGSTTDTIAMKVFGSNNPDADASADTNWVDLSATILGTASVTANNTTVQSIYIIQIPLVINRLMVKVTYTKTGGGTASNAVLIYVQKN